uniref:DUF4157 domain-containing protein n=1 Tax=Ignisphaera aggregans TaxID=334771 RepID=A0A7C5XIB0_9CREN
MPLNRSFIILEAILLFIVIGSLAISYNLYIYRYDIENKVYSITYKSTSTSDEFKAEIIRFVNEIKRDVSRIRELVFIKDVNIVLINTTWALKTWAPKEEEKIPEEMIYREMIYKSTFLVPYNFSIVSSQRGWVSMFLAASVDTSIYINTDYFNPMDKGARNVLAHELTHILQSLHFKMNIPRETDDVLAALALIEGDAGWTQHLYCLDTGLCQPSPRMNIYLDNPYISLLLFPYIYGEDFVKALYTYGGWSLVNKAYTKPPISTSMVMKPDKYIAYLFNGSYTPEDVTISTIYCPYGNPLYNDTLGEYYIMLIFAQRIGLEKALKIADGWNGDRVELYKATEISSYPKWAICWNISWVSQEEAEEFYRSFIEALRKEADVLTIQNNKAYILMYNIEDIEKQWEPGREMVPATISLNISIDNKYVFINVEISPLAIVCKACG